MDIKIQKISEDSIIPSYAHKGDVGLDIYSAEEIILNPGERKRIKTGIKMAIPEGHAGLIWDKSGLAFNFGIKTMAGVVDSGYRGEIMVVLVNLGVENFKIEKYSKIAQMLIQKIENVNIGVVEKLADAERGENGFGSTGLVNK